MDGGAGSKGMREGPKTRRDETAAKEEAKKKEEKMRRASYAQGTGYSS